MSAKIRPKCLALYLFLICCGMVLTIGVPEALGDVSQPGSKGTKDTRLTKPVLIANSRFDAGQQFSQIKDSLNTLFRDHEGSASEPWRLRKSGEIIDQFEGGMGQITIPKVDVYFSVLGMDARLHIGTIKLWTSSTSPKKMSFTVKADDGFKISVDGQPNKTSRVEIKNKVISFDWDFDLQTIVRHKFELNEIKLVDEFGALEDVDVGSIAKISSTGDISENSKGQGRGRTLLKFAAVALLNRVHINTVEIENTIELVDLGKHANAIHNGDETGQLGGWYYGGLFTPQEFLKRAILGKNPLNRLRALETAARINKQGQINMRIAGLEVSPYRLNQFEALDRFVVQNGSYSSKGSLKLEKFDYLDGSGATPGFFMPVSMTLPLSGSMSDMAGIFKALVDVEIANPGVIASLEDGTFKTESFKALRPILVALTNSNTHLQLDNARLTAGAYDFTMKGRVDVSNQSDVGFISDFKIDAIYDAYLLGILNKIAINSQNEGAIALVQRLKEIKGNSRDKTYKTTLNATTGKNGQLRVNGYKIGSPLASFSPDFSSPSGNQKSQPKPVGKARVEPKADGKSDIRERLLRLKKLENDGLITPAEAAEKRKKILEAL